MLRKLTSNISCSISSQHAGERHSNLILPADVNFVLRAPAGEDCDQTSFSESVLRYVDRRLVFFFHRNTLSLLSVARRIRLPVSARLSLAFRIFQLALLLFVYEIIRDPIGAWAASSFRWQADLSVGLLQHERCLATRCRGTITLPGTRALRITKREEDTPKKKEIVQWIRKISQMRNF